MFRKCIANSLENTQCRNAIPKKLLCNFIEIVLWHGCSPVNLLHKFRTPFLKNTSEGLLVMFLARWSRTLFAVTPLKRFFSQPCFQLYNTLSHYESRWWFLVYFISTENGIKKGKYSNEIRIFTFLREQMNDLFDVKDVYILKEIWQMVIWSEGNLMFQFS